MSRIRMKTVRALNENDLKDRLLQARSEYSKLRTDAIKGTLRKKSGKLRPLRRDIARIKTRLSEIKNNE